MDSEIKEDKVRASVVESSDSSLYGSVIDLKTVAFVEQIKQRCHEVG
jgi:hypothetical protein